MPADCFFCNRQPNELGECGIKLCDECRCDDNQVSEDCTKCDIKERFL